MSKPMTEAQKQRKAAALREYYAKKAGKTVDELQEKVHYDYEELKRVVRDSINEARTISKSEIRYRVDGYKRAGKKISMRVVDRVLDELLANGEISKVQEGSFVRFKSNRTNYLDELFGMIPKGSVEAADFYSMEELHKRIGTNSYGYDVPRGYRSYHESANWPSPGGW